MKQRFLFLFGQHGIVYRVAQLRHLCEAFGQQLHLAIHLFVEFRIDGTLEQRPCVTYRNNTYIHSLTVLLCYIIQHTIDEIHLRLVALEVLLQHLLSNFDA